jgi:hypothetical protein
MCNPNPYDSCGSYRSVGGAGSRVSGLLQEPGLCLCDIVHTLLEAPEGGGPEDLPLPRQWPPLLRRWIF